ncbi:MULTISPECIES: hypothetical protein [Pedobacter]|uniref:Uncharacterized protein n=1 Tax=Pedobacter westerhofensis TaxID=425512 RepID=A0A521DRU3_9SPHI|nr:MULTISPECIES: hypothetical protein [Pedobacter]KQR68343.1 hypothetical protein ASF92_15885 [Pedobacter sp. Leaf176]SMO74429.1 hypothetical protein SAMN06265348_106113 [Pedobacter westerhofensis]
MRKAYAISFAVFYLLLTTGMFVCIVHCAGEYLLEPQASNNHHNKAKSHEEAKPHTHKEKPCSKEKDCECCDQHGQYAISENIQNSSSPFFTAFAILTYPTGFKDLFIFRKEKKSMDWPKGNAPPGLLKTPLYISNCTFLI